MLDLGLVINYGEGWVGEDLDLDLDWMGLKGDGLVIGIMFL